MRLVSCVLSPASAVLSVTAKVLKEMSPNFMQILLCGQFVLKKLWWRHI